MVLWTEVASTACIIGDNVKDTSQLSSQDIIMNKNLGFSSPSGLQFQFKKALFSKNTHYSHYNQIFGLGTIKTFELMSAL